MLNASQKWPFLTSEPDVRNIHKSCRISWYVVLCGFSGQHERGLIYASALSNRPCWGWIFKLNIWLFFAVLSTARLSCLGFYYTAGTIQNRSFLPSKTNLFPGPTAMYDTSNSGKTRVTSFHLSSWLWPQRWVCWNKKDSSGIFCALQGKSGGFRSSCLK